MTLTELEVQIRNLLPHAIVETDNHGQLVVYTNVMMKDESNYNSELVEFKMKDGDDDVL